VSVGSKTPFRFCVIENGALDPSDHVRWMEGNGLDLL
jgi:hypothetical protein